MDAFVALATVGMITAGFEPPKRPQHYPPLPPLPSEPVAVSPGQPAPTPPAPKPAPAPSTSNAPTPPPGRQPGNTAQTIGPQIVFKPLIIAPDRPGFSDSTGIAPIGYLQLETGYTFTFRDRDGVQTTTHNGPEVLARVGLLSDRLEIRVGTAGYVWRHTDDGVQGTNASGFADPFAGIKLKVMDQKGWAPRLAFEAVTTMSAGGREVSNRSVEPTFKLLASWELGKKLTLTLNGNLTYASSNGDRFVQGAGSALLSYAVNDKLSVFGEYFVVGPHDKGTDAAHSVDFGAAYLIDSRIQLDARVGAGINNAADNVFVGCGISVLF